MCVCVCVWTAGNGNVAKRRTFFPIQMRRGIEKEILIPTNRYNMHSCFSCSRTTASGQNCVFAAAISAYASFEWPVEMADSDKHGSEIGMLSRVVWAAFNDHIEIDTHTHIYSSSNGLGCCVVLDWT